MYIPRVVATSKNPQNSRDARAILRQIKCKAERDNIEVCDFEWRDLAYACLCPCFAAGKLAQCDSGKEVTDYDFNGVCALYAFFCTVCPWFYSCVLYQLVTKNVFKGGVHDRHATCGHHLFCTHCILASMNKDLESKKVIATEAPGTQSMRAPLVPVNLKQP